MLHIKEKLQTFCNHLLEWSVQPVEALTDLEVAESGYKKGHTPPAEGWTKLSYLQGRDRHFWIRTKVQTPPPQEGKQYLLRFTTGIRGWDSINPQGLLYLNGHMTQGLDTNHTEAFVDGSTSYEVVIYFYTGIVSAPFPFQVELVSRDTEADALYYDILTPLEALDFLNENTTEYRQILTALEQAVNLVDTRAPHSAVFFESIRTAREYLETEFYNNICTTEGKPVVHCIGHTHIDVEWKWARQQTREKMQRSFSTANALMEKYPEYLFTLSQPELYRYLKEEAPEKYEELKRWVEENRWEPEGSMWVECDCNLVSGESFVRQLLQGKQFFRNEFGRENKTLFLPDVFGYSAALPQILKKSGVDYFVTSKISWNDTNTLPVDTFLWEGIDGTDIFTSFITARGAGKNHEYGRISTYVGKINASFAIGAWDRFQQKDYSDHVLLTFGYGDGGGGPTREDLEKQRRLSRGIPGVPVTKMDFLLPYLRTTEQAFYENCSKLGRIPKWIGELYLEFHRGTYTSMAKNKRGNRKSEFLLQKGEALSYTDLFLGGSYDQTGINQAWRKVLHDQFHDILPGSSILEVYEGTDKDYAAIGTYCNDLIQRKLSAIAPRLNTQGGTLVYNALGFPRNGTVSINGQTCELTEPIPAFGWRVVSPFQPDCAVTLNGLTAENPYYILQLDETGRIVSLFDKTAGREVFSAPGNEFQAFEDFPYRYDNWEISDYYKSKQYVLDAPASIKAVHDGSRAGFRIEKVYMDSIIVQHIWLYSRSRRVDFDTDIQWHQQHQILKIAFPLDVHTDSAAYEIQFGHVKRPTHRNTSWDAARFEVCAHKWVDLSENGYGVALLNDCKYGYSTEGSVLNLTALKAGTDPNPQADQGEHRFSYSLLPHTGSLQDAGVIREAYSFNQPLEALQAPAASGSLPETFTLVSCDKENVILETIKKAENSDDMILRLYETFNSRCTAAITVAPGFTRACLCDLMENELEQLPFDGRSLTLPVKNFELITIKFTK